MAFLPAQVDRLVVKIGTQTLTGGGAQIDVRRVQSLCTQIAALRKRGIEVIIVSSGAIGLGMGTLGRATRPKDLPTLQACAAIGQTLMIETWREGLQQHGLTAAQILLTHEDVRGRKRHLSARQTLDRLLALGAIPIVNENDTVSADEIRFGDNDLLSALVASFSKADLLVMLTTARGLLDLAADRLIPVVEEITPEIEALAGGTTSPDAVGGMTSKLNAAKVAMRSGCGVFIGHGREPDILLQLLQGTAVGTFFMPQKLPLGARKRWIAFFGQPRGRLEVDAGAVKALVEDGRSLLAKGLTGCAGEFVADDIVAIHGPDGEAFARGQVRWAAADLRSILGQTSEAIHERFPARKRLEVVHRDQFVVV
ncbi:MAG: glutamate 5-kinase [Opitutales bacterium]